MTSYIHKLYNIRWEYIRTLSPNIVFSSVNTDSSIDSGVATYWFSIDKKYDDFLDENEFLLTVERYDDSNKTWRLLFSWYLDSIRWVIGNDENILSYKFWWLHRLLSEIDCPASFTVYSDKKVKDLVWEIVDYFNLQYPILGTFLWWVIFKNQVTDETLITRTVTWEFTLLQQLQDIFKISWSHFFVKPNGDIIWWPKPTQYVHKLTISKNITKLEIDRVNILWIKNSVIVWWYTFEDPVSIWLYGRRQIRQDIDTTHLPTITNFANKYLAENAYWQREIIADVKVPDFSTISPRDTVWLFNTRIDNVENLQIQKATYNGEIMTLYLEKYTSLPKLIKW